MIWVADNNARLMRPAISPENIYAHRHDEQDVVLWYNRALWHSIVSIINSGGPVDGC
jgi:alpha-ketoglutarate-dependent taurine dioxygenase